jgi:hypothetical protein
MKVLQILVLILGLVLFSNAQECGYTFLRIYLKDAEGKSIKNAEVKTFAKDFNREDFLDYPKNEVDYDTLRKNISWYDQEQAYIGSEGMCGGHRDVGLRISAAGFEIFDKIIDLPLGWTSYSIKLKRKGTSNVAGDVKLTRVFGKILDLEKSGILKARISVFAKETKVFEALTDLDGDYKLFLPVGQYRLEVNAESFQKYNIENFSVLDNKNLNLDLTLGIGDVTKHPPITKNKN